LVNEQNKKEMKKEDTRPPRSIIVDLFLVTKYILKTGKTKGFYMGHIIGKL
jgi:hypothetical protein